MSTPNVVSTRRSIVIETNTAIVNLRRLEDEAFKLNRAINSTANSGKSMVDSLARLQTVQAEITKLKNVLDKGLTPTLDQQRIIVKKLRQELSNMYETSPRFKTVTKDYEAANLKLTEMRERIFAVNKQTKSWLGDLKTIALGAFIGSFADRALMGIMEYFSNLVTGSAKMQDEIAAISSKANITIAETEILVSKIGKIDTRTSSGQLRELAISAGQLGIKTDQIVGFVEAIDKLNVALKEDYAGQDIREIATGLSTLRNNLTNFKTNDVSTDLLNLGNAMLKLGNAGLATAPVVTEVAGRISGALTTFGATTGQILGLSASIQEFGIKSERGASAIVRLTQKIASNPLNFAKALGLDEKEFLKTIDTDIVQALIQVAAAAEQAGTSNTKFGAILKDIDADGVGVSELLNKIANNQQLVKDKVDLATESLLSQDQIMAEFTKKNATLGAELEKLGKEWAKIATSQTVARFLANVVSGLRQFLALLRAIPAFIEENRIGLIALSAGLVFYNAQTLLSIRLQIQTRTALILFNIQRRLETIYLAASIAAQAAYITITNVLIGRTAVATGAMRLFNLVVRANPIGILLTVIGVAVLAFNSFSKATNKLSDEQKILAEVEAKVKEETEGTVSSMERLATAASNSNLSLATRQVALEQLIKINPKYLGGLTLENIKMEEGVNILNTYSILLRKVAQDKALFAVREKIVQEQLRNEIERPGLEMNAANEGYWGNLFQVKDRDKLAESIGQTKELASQLSIVDGKINGSIQAVNDLLVIETTKIKAMSEGTAQYAAQVLKIEGLGKRLSILTGDEGYKMSYGKSGWKKIEDPFKPVDDKANAAALKKDKENDDQTIENAKRLADELQKIRDQLALYYATDMMKEIVEVNNRFDELIERAEKFNPKLAKTFNQLRFEEIGFIEAKYKPQEESFVTNIMAESNADAIAEGEKLGAKIMEGMIKQFRNEDLDEQAVLEIEFITSWGLKKLQARRAQLKLERDMELSNTELTEKQKELIKERYKAINNEDTRAFLQEAANQIQMYGNIISNFLSIADEKDRIREQKLLNREKKINDSKKTMFADQLRRKVISQQEYNRNITALDEAQRKRETEIRKAQWEREKKLRIAQAIISGSSAVLNALATPPWVLGAALALIAGITTAKQIKNIRDTEAPEFGAGGYFLKNGPRHNSKERGLPVINPINNQIEAYLEQGEAIISRRMINQYPELVHALVSSSPVKPWMLKQPSPLNFQQIEKSISNKKMFESGGYFNASTPSQEQQIITQTKEDLMLNQVMIEMLQLLKNPIAPVLPITESEGQAERYRKLKTSSKFSGSNYRKSTSTDNNMPTEAL